MVFLLDAIRIVSIYLGRKMHWSVAFNGILFVEKKVFFSFPKKKNRKYPTSDDAPSIIYQWFDPFWFILYLSVCLCLSWLNLDYVLIGYIIDDGIYREEIYLSIYITNQPSFIQLSWLLPWMNYYYFNFTKNPSPLWSSTIQQSKKNFLYLLKNKERKI